MRTPSLKTLDKTISELNTHFALSNLFAEQFLLSNKLIMQSSPEMCTSDLFNESAAAKRIDIPLRNLNKKISEFDAFLLSQSVARCSEAVKSYFDWVKDFSTLIFESNFSDTQDDFFASIASQVGCTRADFALDEYFLTCDHLRLRRNCLVHNEEEASTAFATVCRQKGTGLNRFWKNRFERTCRVDFNDTDPTNITADAFIDLLHSARISIETFDEKYCKRIPQDKLQKFLRAQFSKDVDCARIDTTRQEKKFKEYSRRLFGI